MDCFIKMPGNRSHKIRHGSFWKTLLQIRPPSPTRHRPRRMHCWRTRSRCPPRPRHRRRWTQHTVPSSSSQSQDSELTPSDRMATVWGLPGPGTPSDPIATVSGLPGPGPPMCCHWHGHLREQTGRFGKTRNVLFGLHERTRAMSCKQAGHLNEHREAKQFPNNINSTDTKITRRWDFLGIRHQNYMDS